MCCPRRTFWPAFPFRAWWGTAVLGFAWVAGSFASTPFGISFTLESPHAAAQNYFGSEGITGVPDVNGDGLDDIAVCSWAEESSGSPNNAGRVYIFDGATREVIRELRDPNEVAEGRFGTALGAISDLNGNGSGEVMVGARNPFRVIVMDAFTGEVLHTLPTRGWGVSALPDVTGDGLPDMAISYFGSSAPGTVKLYDGGSGSLLRTIVSPDNHTANNFFGYDVSAVPDVNGDGRGDVLTGDWGVQGEAGRAYVFDGATGALLHTIFPPAESPGQFGRSVVGLADINGDDRGDLIISSSSGSGGAFVFDGSTGDYLHALNAPETAPGFGWTMSGLSDVDEDGYEDVAVAGFPSFGTLGKVYVFSAATGGFVAGLPGHSEYGGGGSVGGVRDLDGDGRGEVLVASPYATSSAGFVDAGQAYLYLSAPRPGPTLKSLHLRKGAFAMQGLPTSDSVLAIEATSDFESWQQIMTLAPGTNAFEFSDPGASNHSQRFYRAVEVDQALGPPEIIVQPMSQTVTSGETVSFSVTVTNTATLPIQYVWLKSFIFPVVTNVLHDWSHTLILTNVEASAAGGYRVRVSNPASARISNEAQLVVQE